MERPGKKPWRMARVWGFGNDRNVRPRSVCPELGFVHLGNARQELGYQTAILENDVSLDGRAVSQEGFPLPPEVPDQIHQFVTVRFDSSGEDHIGRRSEDSQRLLGD